MWLLPMNAEDQDRLAKSKTRSKLGSIVFLSVLAISLLWTISTAVYRLHRAWSIFKIVRSHTQYTVVPYY